MVTDAAPRDISAMLPRERARPSFLRLLGAVYFIAFWSLWDQLPLLIGKNGLLPAAESMENVRANIPAAQFYKYPTIFWLDGSDAVLRAAAVGGAAFSFILMFLAAPRICLALIWILYLSFTVVCGSFLSFQWDNLLIETAFFAWFYAPGGILPFRRHADPPPRAAEPWRFLMIWLLFRLNFESGLAKMMSHDPNWSFEHLTALESYYETAPLPTWIGWYAHQMPPLFHKISTCFSLAAELAVPFLLFLGKWPRRLAICIFCALQLSILLTANYGIFNYLSFVLCIPALEERGPALARAREMLKSWKMYIFMFVAAVLVFLTSVDFLRGVGGLWRPADRYEREHLPIHERAIIAVDEFVSPFRTFNSYHLFANLTLTRAELEIQAKNDDGPWANYEFKYKPGNPTRAPGFVAPHQPRVDFRLWFLARVRRDERGAWQVVFAERDPQYLNRLVERITTNPQSVAELFSGNPFPDHPPRYVRLVFYHYRMSSRAERADTGLWWVREPVAAHPYIHDARSGQKPRY